jgi:glycosyltransferase involved in cell wall biosynthesis
MELIEKKVVRIISTSNRYGGHLYEEMIDDALTRCCSYTIFDPFRGISRRRFFKAIYLFICVVHNIWLFTRNTKADVLIMSNLTSFFLPKQTLNIVIIHHLDNSYSPWQSKLHQCISFILLRMQRRKVSLVVVVSEFWKVKLEKYGFDNIEVIHNGFDLSKFEISKSAVAEFKVANKLNKPYIYIGNQQTKKGFFKVVKNIRSDKYELISSGKPHKYNPNIRNFDLQYRDYLLLIAGASAVVTMSLFKEGWCRTAHEAMLCGVPVIGSGSGGMRELLENGDQIICEEFYNLNDIVDKISCVQASKNRGYSYSSQFTIELFELNWIKLISKIG